MPEQVAKLHGKIQARGVLRGKIQARGVLRGGLRLPDFVGGEVYQGNCTIKPTTADQILPTAGLSMRDNVVVKCVPYAEVTNISNGTTVTIG